MKKLVVLFFLFACANLFTTSAQVKVSILGDSYSTFEGWNPEGHATWYDKNLRNDVTDVEQTWWYQLIEDNGLQLEKNNSWSGATICNTGYGGEDYSEKSFLTRSGDLGNSPDIIYVFGGTNDDWASSPLGDANGSDMYTVRPATKAMFKNIKAFYPDALCVAIINSEMSKDVENAIIEACQSEDIPYIQLKAIDKQKGHPSISGMKAIAHQVWKATAPRLYAKLRSSKAS